MAVNVVPPPTPQEYIDSLAALKEEFQKAIKQPGGRVSGGSDDISSGTDGAVPIEPTPGIQDAYWWTDHRLRYVYVIEFMNQYYEKHRLELRPDGKVWLCESDVNETDWVTSVSMHDYDILSDGTISARARAQLQMNIAAAAFEYFKI